MEQIIGVLKQAEVGAPVAQLIRRVVISERTFCRWKKQYVGLEVDQVRQMKQLQVQDARVKQLVAELSLDETMLQDVLRKKWQSPRGGVRWWIDYLRVNPTLILWRPLPELRQCPHEDSASLVAIPFSLLVAIVCAVRSLAHNLQSQSVGLRSPDRNGDQDVAHGIL